jgi:hypothetical protein
MGISMVKQFITIKQAKDKNSSLATETFILKKNNQDFLRKIEHATTSAFLNQQSRIILGMGSDNDYWIKGYVNEEIDLYPKPKNKENENNMVMWIKLFTD